MEVSGRDILNSSNTEFKDNTSVEQKRVVTTGEVLSRYDELMKIKKSNEYRSYLIDKEKGINNTKFDYLDSELSDLERYLSKLPHINENTNNMKTEILKLVSPNLNQIEKARKLYLELNKRVSYDINYMNFINTKNNDGKSQIYNRDISFDNLDSNYVICKGWSQLYRELLISCGFSPDKVKIMGENKVGSHKWIEIELDNGNIIIADATDSINGELDLAKCKSSFSSNGFFYCNKFFSGARLEKINLSKSDKSDLLRIESTIKDYNEGEIDLSDEEYANLYNKYKKLSNKLDLENIGKDQWKDIDKKLGYFYYDDKIKKGNSLFKGSKLYKKLFGSEKFDNMVIDKFIDLEIPSNMEGLDAYVYLKKLSNIYGIESTTNFFCHNIGDNYEVVATWGSNNINRYKSNRNVYIVYSKSIGKKVFYNFEEYNNFVRNLTFN